MAKRHKDDDIDVRERILEVASKAIAERGLRGASVRYVADKAGFNSSMIFYYFGNKVGLYQAVMERYGARMRERFGPLESGVHAPRVAAVAMVEGYFDFLVEHPEYAQLIVQAQTMGAPEELERMANINQKNITQVLDILERSFGGTIGRQPLLQFTLTIIGMTVHYFTNITLLASSIPDNDPQSAQNLAERRQHLLWVTHAIIDGLEAGYPR